MFGEKGAFTRGHTKNLYGSIGNWINVISNWISFGELGRRDPSLVNYCWAARAPEHRGGKKASVLAATEKQTGWMEPPPPGWIPPPPHSIPIPIPPIKRPIDCETPPLFSLLTHVTPIPLIRPIVWKLHLYFPLVAVDQDSIWSGLQP